MEHTQLIPIPTQVLCNVLDGGYRLVFEQFEVSEIGTQNPPNQAYAYTHFTGPPRNRFNNIYFL